MSTLTAPPHAAEQELTEEERQQKLWDYYEQKVLEAMEDDTWIQGTPEFWENLRKEAHDRREARKMSAVARNQ